MPEPTPLTADDLISNEPLHASGGGQIAEDDDRFQHRHVARRVAELVAAPGSRVNVAVNGPWGSGKSTFFALLKEELDGYLKDDTNPKSGKRFLTIDFDAWQMADETFESNFLATVARRVQSKPTNVEQQLFRANRTVSLPFGLDLAAPWQRGVAAMVTGLFFVFLIFGVPALQAGAVKAVADAVADGDLLAFWPVYGQKLLAWFGTAASGTVLIIVFTALVNLRKVTVQESGPAHVTQFRTLFSRILSDKTTTYVILIDELDRCAPEAVMKTLEGLRRFLGHDNCVFVVAFDRESVVETIDSELRRKVPARPGRPYYSTAGEYLDKIFTYQVALPPQPRKAFRAYARDLVDSKGHVGVWGELRGYDTERLYRVISILSPPHLTSPRRTKVILNDFAINARLTESFTGTWVERSEEIAVLTVLQTEFPLFYADLEHYPNLLTHMAGVARTDPGVTLQPLLKRYQQEHAALDTVLTETPDGQKHPDPGNDPGKALTQQLMRFLRKLVEMRVTFPQADLIQLGTNRRMLNFDDPAVYSIVEAATEVPRDETLERLRTATNLDRYRATELMLQSIEGEASTEAMTLRILAGSLLSGLEPAQHESLIPQIDSAWQRIVEEQSVNALTEDAFEGFTSTLLPGKDGDWVNALLHATYEDPTLHTRGLAAVSAHASDDAIAHSSRALLAGALVMLPQHALLIEVLRRMDGVKTTALDHSSGARAAKDLEADADTNDEESLDDIATAVDALVTLALELPVPSQSRRWILNVLRIRAATDEDATSAYLDLLDRLLADEEKAISAVHEILVTVTRTVPETLKASLAARLTTGVKPAESLLAPALMALLKIIADSDSEAHDDAAHGIAVITDPSMGGADIDTVEVRKHIGETYASTAARTRARYDLLLDVAHSLAQVPSLTALATELIATLTANGVRDVTDSTDRVHAIQGLRRAPADALRLVLDDLSERLPGTHGRRKWMVNAILGAHHRLLQLGEEIQPLAADDIKPYLEMSGDPVAMSSWIETAPPAEDILAVLDGEKISSVKAVVWAEYALHAGTSNSTELWTAGVREGAPASTLRALASHGVSGEARSNAARRLARATNTPARRHALGTFDTLPRNELAASAIAPVLEQWALDARVSEARMVFDVVGAHHAHFASTTVKRLKELIPEWAERVKSNLSASATQTLMELGYLPSARNSRRRRVKAKKQGPRS